MMQYLTEIIVALLALAGTAIGSFVGIRTTTKIMIYRIGLLEKKVDKHNSVVERMPVIEGILAKIPDIEKKIETLQDEVNKLKICVESSKGVLDKIESLQDDINDMKLLVARMQ